jgi:CRISPR-associated protein Csm1
MSEQILLQGKLLGIEEFLLSGSDGGDPSRRSSENELAGRSHWVTLLCEVLPRALLAELGLARILLGSSGGGQFLVVLPGEARPAAEEFLTAAARQVREIGGGHLRLLWAATENLGDWSVVRKRLNDQLGHKAGTPLASAGRDAFLPSTGGTRDVAHDFGRVFGLHSRQQNTVGWSPDSPGSVSLEDGKHKWEITTRISAEGIMLARHVALTDDGAQHASLATLARRAHGRRAWGVLRGDVDSFGVRLRRVTSIEEHVPLSVLYKQFFAGELEVLCSLPDFWRKVSILYSGGDDFAVFGSWDALVQLARELQRLFHRFTEENLKEYPGAEGKTISMALAIAPDMHTPFTHVYREAGQQLEQAKSVDKDCISLLGRVLEWRHLSDAAELKDIVTRLEREYRGARGLIRGLRHFYQKEAYGDPFRDQQPLMQRTWRFQRRFNRLLSGTRNREFQKLRAHLISEMAIKKSADVKLRPAGMVALEWARLATEV